MSWLDGRQCSLAANIQPLHTLPTTSTVAMKHEMKSGTFWSRAWGQACLVLCWGWWWAYTWASTGWQVESCLNLLQTSTRSLVLNSMEWHLALPARVKRRQQGNKGVIFSNLEVFYSLSWNIIQAMHRKFQNILRGIWCPICSPQQLWKPSPWYSALIDDENPWHQMTSAHNTSQDHVLLNR